SAPAPTPWPCTRRGCRGGPRTSWPTAGGRRRATWRSTAACTPGSTRCTWPGGRPGRARRRERSVNPAQGPELAAAPAAGHDAALVGVDPLAAAAERAAAGRELPAGLDAVPVGGADPAAVLRLE